MRDIGDGGLLSRLRKALTAAVKQESGAQDTGFLEQVEEFFQAGYRAKWEQMKNGTK